MKRYGFLTIIFLAMVMVIALTSNSPAPVNASSATAADAVILSQAVVPAQAAVQSEKPAAPEERAAQLPLSDSPTSQTEQAIPVTGDAPALALNEAVVTADVLNMRVGPGMNHRIMRQLVVGQKLTLTGRSENGEWLAVKLADGREGWVYGSYLRHNTNLAALPVREAYGGPLTSAPQAQPTAKPSGRYTLNVSIGFNQAEVTMANFAADRDVTLRLAVPAEGLSMTVAGARTDAQGSASVIFDMPTQWPDGSAVTQSQIELQVLGADGKLMGKARISYQSPW